MLPTKEGAIRLFRVSGIDVYLHWSWFVVAFFEVEARGGAYRSPVWNIAEYLTLFLIVLLHEFGHSLACRQVGGRADQIVLWPLGGVAYVAPPQRPGATLWSIAAGPLVNVLLMPVLVGLMMWQRQNMAIAGGIDAANYLRAIAFINGALLIFNILPIYPLDGGQMLRSLLWFPLGRARSLQVATIVGFIGVAGLAALSFYLKSIFMGVMTAFIFMNCRQGWQQSRALFQLDSLRRRAGFACPSCHTSPPVGAFWPCSQCQTPFDPFDTAGRCPHCGGNLEAVQCPDCGTLHSMDAWTRR